MKISGFDPIFCVLYNSITQNQQVCVSLCKAKRKQIHVIKGAGYKVPFKKPTSKKIRSNGMGHEKVIKSTTDIKSKACANGLLRVCWFRHYLFTLFAYKDSKNANMFLSFFQPFPLEFCSFFSTPFYLLGIKSQKIKFLPILHPILSDRKCRKSSTHMQYFCFRNRYLNLRPKA